MRLNIQPAPFLIFSGVHVGRQGGDKQKRRTKYIISGAEGIQMRYKHFYDPASTHLRHKEDEALRLWSSTLRRGLSALQYKRYQAAEIYLGAAYEIGILRLDCSDNAIFDATHVVQPAVRMMECFLAQGNIAGASSFFNETQYL